MHELGTGVLQLVGGDSQRAQAIREQADRTRRRRATRRRRRPSAPVPFWPRMLTALEKSRRAHLGSDGRGERERDPKGVVAGRYRSRSLLSSGLFILDFYRFVAIWRWWVMAVDRTISSSPCIPWFTERRCRALVGPLPLSLGP
jgi:hypothetical protein